MSETKKPEEPRILSTAELTPELIEEAIAMSRRYDRNLANRDGADAFPVPCRTARLLALTVLNLSEKLKNQPVLKKGDKFTFKADAENTGAIRAPAPRTRVSKAVKETPKPQAKKVGKANPGQKAATAKAVAKDGPPLTAERLQAFEGCKAVIRSGTPITARAVANIACWKSHGTAARHIRTLIDLGYLKRVGAAKVLTLTGLEPFKL